MRWSVFFVLQALILAAVGWLVFSHQDHVTVLKEPPQSLAQWYKPQSKRHVWLHTMFKLRREMVALDLYAKAEDEESLQKWAAKLETDYAKIAEMVPEWTGKLDLAAMAALQSAVQEKRFGDVTDALAALGGNCKACHVDFRVVTAALYRAPDFSKIKVKGEPLSTHMRVLSRHVNEMVIAIADERPDAASAAFTNLQNAMTDLGGVCAECHKKGRQVYLNASVTQAMAELEQALETGSAKDRGRAVGTAAVLACARCHGTHRLSSDVKQLLEAPKSWAELLKHSF